MLLPTGGYASYTTPRAVGHGGSSDLAGRFPSSLLIGLRHGTSMQVSSMQVSSVPWRAWFGDTSVDLSFPDHWDVHHFDMADAPALPARSLQDALSDPIDAPPLADLARPARRVAIAVDDLSRPTPASEIVPLLLQTLEAAGVSRDRLQIVISLGSHSLLKPDEIRRKLGDEVAASVSVVNHDCHDDLLDIGLRVGQVPVRINRSFLEADLRIVLGSVVPHPFAGFSGGAKMILPGLANLESIEWTHLAVVLGRRGAPGTLEGNQFRPEFERVARHVGVHFSVNVVVNSRRKIAGLFAGDIVTAHREAAAFAGRVCATPLPAEPLDVAVLNAYPKDDELLQAESAFVFHQSAPAGYVKEDGVVVLVSACSLGMGHHGLFGPGQRLYRPPRRRAFLGNRVLAAMMPGVTGDQFHQMYPEDYPHFATWDGALAFLQRRYPHRPRVGIFPCASIQVAR